MEMAAVGCEVVDVPDVAAAAPGHDKAADLPSSVAAAAADDDGVSDDDCSCAACFAARRRLMLDSF